MLRSSTRLLVSMLALVSAARMSLHRAAEDAQIEPLKVAIRGRYDAEDDERKKPDLNAKNKKGQVALHLAVCAQEGTGDPKRMQGATALLDGGANPNAKDGNDETPLHVIARACNHLDNGAGSVPMARALAAAKLLLKRSADADAAGLGDEVGATPLHVAAAEGHLAIVQLLLGLGKADVNARDATGATPLMYAARKLRGKVAHALIKAGADPQLVDSEGKTARDAVADGKDSFAVAIRGHIDRYRAIRKEGEEEKKAKAAKAPGAKAEL